MMHNHLKALLHDWQKQSLQWAELMSLKMMVKFWRPQLQVLLDQCKKRISTRNLMVRSNPLFTRSAICSLEHIRELCARLGFISFIPTGFFIKLQRWHNIVDTVANPVSKLSIQSLLSGWRVISLGALHWGLAFIKGPSRVHFKFESICEKFALVQISPQVGP